MLILDEPTTAVDPKQVKVFMNCFLLFTNRNHHPAVSHDIGVIAQYVDAIACVIERYLSMIDRNGITDETLTEMYGREAAFFHHGIVPHIVVRRSSPVHYCSGETAEDDENHHKP